MSELDWDRVWGKADTPQKAGFAAVAQVLTVLRPTPWQNLVPHLNLRAESDLLPYLALPPSISITALRLVCLLIHLQKCRLLGQKLLATDSWSWSNRFISNCPHYPYLSSPPRAPAITHDFHSHTEGSMSSLALPSLYDRAALLGTQGFIHASDTRGKEKALAEEESQRVSSQPRGHSMCTCAGLLTLLRQDSMPLLFSRWGMGRNQKSNQKSQANLPTVACLSRSQVQALQHLTASLVPSGSNMLSTVPDCNHHGLGPDQSQRLSRYSGEDHLPKETWGSQSQGTDWDKPKLENFAHCLRLNTRTHVCVPILASNHCSDLQSSRKPFARWKFFPGRGRPSVTEVGWSAQLQVWGQGPTVLLSPGSKLKKQAGFCP